MTPQEHLCLPTGTAVMHLRRQSRRAFFVAGKTGELGSAFWALTPPFGGDLGEPGVLSGTSNGLAKDIFMWLLGRASEGSETSLPLSFFDGRGFAGFEILKLLDAVFFSSSSSALRLHLLLLIVSGSDEKSMLVLYVNLV